MVEWTWHFEDATGRWEGSVCQSWKWKARWNRYAMAVAWCIELVVLALPVVSRNTILSPSSRT